MSITEKEFSKRLFSLIDRNSKVIIAFSGGCDSLCLAALCSKVLPKNQVCAVYVNHNIRSRAELESETELNCMNCDILHIPLEICEIPRFGVRDYSREHDCGTEAAARNLRYEILEKKRLEMGFDYILTAHHLDDQIETVLMKKLMNSPEPSLRGISDIAGSVVRPLLTYKRQDTEDYVRELGLSFSTDSTNCDNSIYRNKIRNIILPEMRKKDPNCDSKILELRKKALEACGNVVLCNSHKVEIQFLKSLNDTQKLMQLYALWDNVVGTGRGLSQEFANRVLKAVSEEKTTVIEACGGCFELHKGWLYLSDVTKEKEFSDFEYAVEDFNLGSIELPGFRILSWGEKVSGPITSDDLFLSDRLFTGQVIVRYLKNGDRIFLKDGSKPVSKLLQDLGVPSSLRNRVPLICDDEGPCAVFGSAFGARNRIARKFCGKNGTRFSLLEG